MSTIIRHMSMLIRPQTMQIDPKLLTLAQWLSPSFPMGAFAYSHGLETAIHENWVTGEDSLYDWLHGVLSEGSGLSDAVLIWQANHSTDPAAVDAVARAFAPAAERLREAERQGAAFARVVRDVWHVDLPDFLLPVALGHAARQVKLAPEALLSLYLHSFTSNLVQAAQRLMPLGQTAGQRTLHRLTQVCDATAKRAQELPLERIHSNAFLSDIAAMRHETMEPRLFQS